MDQIMVANQWSSLCQSTMGRAKSTQLKFLEARELIDACTQMFCSLPSPKTYEELMFRMLQSSVCSGMISSVSHADQMACIWRTAASDIFAFVANSLPKEFPATQDEIHSWNLQSINISAEISSICHRHQPF